MKGKGSYGIQLGSGILLIAIGLATQWDWWSMLLAATGGGLVFQSIRQMVRTAYWRNPRRQALYEKRMREAHISSVDERQQFLRMKAGHVACQIMTVSLAGIAFLLALLHVEVWVLGLVFSLLVLQWAAGTLAYRVLDRRM